MSKTKIKVINVKFTNDKMQIETLVKQAEIQGCECFLNINKSFNVVSYEIIRDEIVFMPICKKGYCWFSICSFNLDDYHESQMLKNIKEIASLYIQSQIEECEVEIKNLDNRIINLQKLSLTCDKMIEDKLSSQMQ